MYQLRINVNLMASPRPRFARAMGVYMSSEYLLQKARIRTEMHLRKVHHEPLVGPIWVRLLIFRPRPITSRRKVYDTKPDIDNLVKTVMDAGNKMIWHDDAAIVRLEATKIYILNSETDSAHFIIDYGPMTLEKINEIVRNAEG